MLIQHNGSLEAAGDIKTNSLESATTKCNMYIKRNERKQSWNVLKIEMQSLIKAREAKVAISWFERVIKNSVM